MTSRARKLLFQIIGWLILLAVIAIVALVGVSFVEVVIKGE